MEYFDQYGNKVEAYTPEEVEKKIDEERLAAIEEANADRNDEIENLNRELEEKTQQIEQLQNELEKEKNKDKNLSGQRKVIEDKETEINELKKQLEEFKNDYQAKLGAIESKTKESVVINLIDKIAGNDSNLKEKIKFYYDNFKGEPANDEETKERIRNAYILATGAKAPVSFSGEVISSVGAPVIPNVNIPEEKLSNPAAVDIAHKLGITDQDLKKHKLI